MHLGDQLPLNLQFRGFPCGVGKERHSLRPNDRHLPLLFLPELLFDAAVPGFGESVAGPTNALERTTTMSMRRNLRTP
jgi:hypothetical protein